MVKDHCIDTLCRIVYLRPNLYSDERLAICVIVSAETKMHLKTIVNSGLALSALNDFFDQHAQEQTMFALKILDHYVKTNRNIADLEPPSDILRFGPPTNATCEDPEQFAHDLLEISSSLYRAYQCKTRVSESIGQEEVTTNLFHSVTELNALKATGLFKGARISLSGQSSIRVPILGDRIIGVPVSFVTKQIANAKTQAEAFIAKYSIAGKRINKKPAVYILTPSHEYKINQKHIEDGLAELKAVADGHNVLLRHERSLSELAHALLRDEAA